MDDAPVVYCLSSENWELIPVLRTELYHDLFHVSATLVCYPDRTPRTAIIVHHPAGDNHMLVILTAMFRVKDWKALRCFSDQQLIAYARVAGASRYQIYRNIHDAAEALLIVEVSSHGAMVQINNAITQMCKHPIIQPALRYRGDVLDDRIWEPTECIAIE
jgi:hypothetical protein